jgi:asparagine synthetase B (glutamine-hydrolysing)
MSGIVAYTGTRPAAPVILTEAARGAASKGPHGHGWVTDNDGAHRTLGPWNSHLFTDTTTGARWLLGHSRLATNGRHRDTTALQPLEHNGHWGVHNGNVYNAHDLWPDAPVDSAALIKVYADHRAHDLHPHTAMDATVEAANTPAFALVIRDSTGELVMHRRRMPLWAHIDHGHGVYISSRAFAAAYELPENRTITTTDLIPPPTRKLRYPYTPSRELAPS